LGRFTSPLGSAAGVAGIVLDGEGALIGADGADAHEPHAAGAVELVGEGDSLAAIGIGAGSLAGRLGVGHVFGDDAKAFRLRKESGPGDLEGGVERIDHDERATVSHMP
jgi:hypothetical protein